MIYRVITITLGLGSILANASCATFAHPLAPWNEPIDLDLGKDELKGLVVELECGKGNIGEIDWEVGSARACKQITSYLEDFGIVVVKPDTKEPADDLGDEGADSVEDLAAGSEDTGEKPLEKHPKSFSLTYVERVASRGISISGEPDDADRNMIRFGWTLFPCVLSLTFFPCIEVSQSMAEIMVFDKHDVLRKRYPLRARYTEVAGLWALLFMVIMPNTEQMTRHLGTYILDVVQTTKVNMELADRRMGAP
jgi:hypothetical protein